MSRQPKKKKNPFKIGRSVLVVKATYSSVDSKEKRALILVDSFLTHTQKKKTLREIM